MSKRTLRIRPFINESGELEHTFSDSLKRKQFLKGFKSGSYVLETLKKIGKPGSELELKDRLRRYYFSQVAGPIGSAMGGQSAEYVHSIMKSIHAIERDKLTGLNYTASVFADDSKKDNEYRMQFIKKSKLTATDFFPEIIFPEFIPEYDYES